VICDFVCPTPETRAQFDADIVIWMDTIEKGRFADTNAIFVPPAEGEYDYHITEKMSLKDTKKFIEDFEEQRAV
jgi:adenylylsulfate kinase